MKHSFTYEKAKNLDRKKHVLNIAMLALSLITAFSAQAQNTLVGLTSNGGINGKGTAFSLSTNGNNFSVINGFNDWGNTANGSLFKNDDGNFYGMTSRGGTNNMENIFMMMIVGQVSMLKHL